jgi:hypothetical protein
MRRRLLVTALVAAVGTILAVPPPALADTAQAAVVSTNPVDNTPDVLDGAVFAFAQVGNSVVVGGTFAQVAPHGSTIGTGRYSIFAYDLGTGAITGFNPRLDGPVSALAAGPNGTVYVAGHFTHVDGTQQRGLTQLDVGTGQRVPAFNPHIIGGDVRTLAYRNGALFIGGSFNAVNGQHRLALARLAGGDGSTAANFAIALSAPHAPVTKVEDMSVTGDGSRLVAIGTIDAANGQPRHQLVMIDQASGTARVSGWFTSAYSAPCDAVFATYLRAVDFSPDGRYFVVVTTGRLSGPDRMCDTAARFNATGTGDHHPAWINHTGGNSLLAVDVTGAAVYVGGHEQWLDNPQGNKTAGPGAAYRPGIGAIDPTSGRAMAWNPTRTRGVGVHAFLACSGGLLVGSDTDELGHEHHGKFGMFPPGSS